ncbi:TIGR03752 family integrating conjugative element protein [Orbus sturtevantii]|uniref:TIGR03752 family integrating conjugative element protein n=1 Tax=Orbus sturtevantii TaxID=3074109 RepID=UPI00370D062C
MAKIKGNKLLPIIVIGIIVLGAIIVLIANKGEKNASTATQVVSPYEKEEVIEVADLSKDELSVLGVTGDTEKDTVQTLITLVKAIKKEQADTQEELKKLKADNARLNREGGQYYKLTPPNTNANRAVNNEPSVVEKQINVISDKLNQLTAKLPTLPASNNEYTTHSSNIPIGKGQGAASKSGQMQQHSGQVNDDDIVWVSPSDQMVVDKKVTHAAYQFPTSFNGIDPIRSKLKDHKEAINQPLDDKTSRLSEPVYTVPVNSTLMGSVSMTALLGRIPIDGVVSDPYPFKAVIGRENLIANGIELPHVEGAIVSGTATGDYVLSCVRGSVKSITFVFDDGRILTIPESKNNTSSSGNNSEIGWLSDEYGIPCISGEIKSNAAQYLASVIGLGTAAAAADAMAQQNTTVVTDGGNVTNAVTGNNSQYVLGKGLSGGINQTIDWFNKRYGQTFDAVYVPPGQDIAIHITKELDIDYLYNGRLVDYDVNTKKLGGLD